MSRHGNPSCRHTLPMEPLKVGLAKMGFYVVGSAVCVSQFWIRRGADCLHRLSPCADVRMIRLVHV